VGLSGVGRGSGFLPTPGRRCHRHGVDVLGGPRLPHPRSGTGGRGRAPAGTYEKGRCQPGSRVSGSHRPQGWVSRGDEETPKAPSGRSSTAPPRSPRPRQGQAGFSRTAAGGGVRPGPLPPRTTVARQVFRTAGSRGTRGLTRAKNRRSGGDVAEPRSTLLFPGGFAGGGFFPVFKVGKRVRPRLAEGGPPGTDHDQEPGCRRRTRTALTVRFLSRRFTGRKLRGRARRPGFRGARRDGSPTPKDASPLVVGPGPFLGGAPGAGPEFAATRVAAWVSRVEFAGGPRTRRGRGRCRQARTRNFTVRRVENNPHGPTGRPLFPSSPAVGRIFPGRCNPTANNADPRPVAAEFRFGANPATTGTGRKGLAWLVRGSWVGGGSGTPCPPGAEPDPGAGGDRPRAGDDRARNRGGAPLPRQLRRGAPVGAGAWGWRPASGVVGLQGQATAWQGKRAPG